MKRLMLVAALAGIALVAACGGGGSDSETPGSGALQVAERVSVVDAQAATETSISKAMKVDFAKAASSLPSSSAYATDTTHTYVEERSADSFMRINEILCSMAQTRYVDMLNQGDYKAQIDITQCGQNNDSAEGAGASSQNQSTGQNATEYEMWTVNSSRETDQPHIVSVWMHKAAEEMGDFSEPAKTIYVKVTITEGVSDANPIGIFTADFKGCLDDDPTCASPMMTGYLKAERDSDDNVLLKFYVGGGFGDFTFTEQATLNKSPDGNSGGGSVSVSDFNEYKGAITEAFNISYDADHFYRGDASGENAVCLDRSNFSTNVWRYGLYFDENHATPGARVSRANPGFPIKFESGGETYYGNAGYYGVWLPADAAISTGSTVYKQIFSSSGPPTEIPYTVFVANGRLRKHVRQNVTLGDIKDVPLSWSKCDQQEDETWSCQDYRVKWDGAQLIRDAVRTQLTNWMWKNLDASEVVAFSDSDFSFNFWSESLGGDGRIDLMNKDTGEKLTALQLTDATEVIFNKVSTVYPGDSVPATFACFENCMDPEKINTGEPYFEQSSYKGGENNFNFTNQDTPPDSLVAGTNYIEYAFDTDSMLLTQSGNPVVLTSSDQENGVWGGALVDPADFAGLACDWDPTQTCTWNVWDLDVFYTWETGANEWNKLTALRDGNGQYVAFDPPLMVEYTRPTNSAKYYLEYNGFGDLWGIPGKCVNADSGLDVECYTEEGDKTNVRWIPEFSIAEDSAVRDATSSLTYYVKPLDQEQQMISTEISACSGAGLALVSYALPDASLVADPGIGTEPSVTNAPAVIGGVLQ